MSNTPFVKTTGVGSAAMCTARSARPQSLSRKRSAAAATMPSGRQRPALSLRGGGEGRRHFLAIAVQLLHAREAAFHQQAQVVQDAVDDLGFPDRVELDLLVEPLLEPFGVRQPA